GADMDAGTATDGAMDTSSEASVDVPADAGPVDTGPVRCRADMDCMAVTGAPVCDLISGICVACVPTADSCPPGSYCTDARTCTPGCRNASDCVGTDAGMRCDTARRVCVGCLADADCAPG